MGQNLESYAVAGETNRDATSFDIILDELTIIVNDNRMKVKNLEITADRLKPFIESFVKEDSSDNIARKESTNIVGKLNDKIY
jgi:Asp-tRNA(Asn)/Glu-tRNA(Gln) amidotransferase B subunit